MVYLDMRYEIIGKLVDECGYDVRRSLPLNGIVVTFLGREIDVTGSVLDQAKNADQVIGYLRGAFEQEMYGNVVRRA